ALHVFSTKQVSPGFFSEPQPQPRIPRWRFWAKQQSKPRVSRASLTMQDHDFIVKNGARKIDGSLPLCRSQHRRNMRILYDGRVFQFQKAGGVNRIYAEVISGLPADYHPLITGVEDFGRNVPSHPNLEQPRFKHFRPGRISVRVRERWWKPRLLDSLDLFHPTYYDLTDGFSFSDFKCPTVLTVYDFIYAIYPKLIEGAEGVIRNQTEAIRKADHIICISKATENNLLERFPEKQGK